MSAPEPQKVPRDVLEVERPEQLKALGHPLRLKVLQVLGESEKPLTNRELAASLSVDPGHLHFHVRMLHRAELIELADVAGREKPYRPVAKHFVVARRFAPPGWQAISRARSSARCSAASISSRRRASSGARSCTRSSTSRQCAGCLASSSTS